MILALFGYAKTGKTLLFNLLTDQQKEVSKFAAQKNELHQAITKIPDRRLTQISDLYKIPPVYANIEFLDTGSIAYGEAKSSTFLDILRRSEGLVHVVRGFEDQEIIHPKGSIKPDRDIQNMQEELKSTDYISIEKRFEKLTIDRKKIKSNEIEKELKLLSKLKDRLENNIPLKEINLNPEEEKMIKGFNFLSLKNLINIVNTDEKSYHDLLPLEKSLPHTYVFSAKIEKELLELETDERKIFEEEFGLVNYQYLKHTFKNKCYQSMNLISFFTIGSNEIKSWTIEDNTNAYTAAGKIHTDIQQGFIRAEVINYQELLNQGSITKAKKKGLVRLEGKDYIVNDGDVIQFRFNK